jgi:hypothetical protein
MLNHALQVFDELHDAGVRFKVTEGELQVTAPRGLLTDELKQAIAANKAQLVELIESATGVLNRYGVQMIGSAVGLWRVADLPEVRRALKALGLGDAEVRYLDDPGVDIPNELREFVPPRIQQTWDDQGVLGTPQERIEAEGKARWINAIFDELGTSPTPSRITAETVLHGELARRKQKHYKQKNYMSGFRFGDVGLWMADPTSVLP